VCRGLDSSRGGLGIYTGGAASGWGITRRASPVSNAWPASMKRGIVYLLTTTCGCRGDICECQRAKSASTKTLNDSLTGLPAPATPSWKVDSVVWCNTWNTIFQGCLAGVMWGINRFTYIAQVKPDFLSDLVFRRSIPLAIGIIFLSLLGDRKLCCGNVKNSF